MEFDQQGVEHPAERWAEEVLRSGASRRGDPAAQELWGQSGGALEEPRNTDGNSSGEIMGDVTDGEHALSGPCRRTE